jgi:diguanylate cyclase
VVQLGRASDSDAVWKQKYYDRLEQYEADEVHWQQTEQSLRRALSRVSLAAEGLNPQLDNELEKVRNAIRCSIDAGTLASQLESLSAVLTELDTEPAASRHLNASQVLATVLDKIAWPRAVKRRARALRRKFHKIEYQSELVPLLDDVVQLVHEAFGHSDVDNAPAPSLLKRLAGASGNSSGAVDEEPAIEGAVAESLDLARSVLEYIIDALRQREHVDLTELDDAEGRLTTASQERDLLRVADRIMDVLRHDAVLPRHNIDAGDQAVQGENAVNEVLIQLLERLSLPAELEGQVESLKDKLGAPLEDSEWAGVLATICELITEMRRNVQREKKDLETFLSQLTDRLFELDENVQNAEFDRDESHRRGQQLGETVSEHVSGIETSVREFADLDQLKQSVQQQLDQIRHHMEAHLQAEEVRNREAGEKMKALTERLHGLEEEANTLRNRVREQRNQALRDPLTGINNRLAFDERLENEYARWRRFGNDLTLMVWDVDNFKSINDGFGHKTGDKVLIVIAQLLASQIRETDFIARYGGEEFVVIAPGSGSEASLNLAEKLRASVEERKFTYLDSPVPVTVSCGIAEFKDGLNAEQVFEKADQALYHAKRNGRNRCEVAD